MAAPPLSGKKKEKRYQMAEAQQFFFYVSLNGTRRISPAEQQRRLRFATCHNATLGTHIQQGAAGAPVR